MINDLANTPSRKVKNTLVETIGDVVYTNDMMPKTLINALEINTDITFEVTYILTKLIRLL